MRSNFADNFQIYLQPTKFVDSDSLEIIKFAKDICNEESSDVEKVIKLYYTVRDTIYYDPYRIEFSVEGLKASSVLKRKYGFCITKSILLAALARSVGIPSRLGFADVKNHLSTGHLRSLMKSDIFAYHGYAELYLNKNWIKATPAFNLSLCERFNVKPLEFDGKNDSLFHEFDRKGNKHMEYIRDHGPYADLPYKQVLDVFREHYPALFSKNAIEINRSFEEEAQIENK